MNDGGVSADPRWKLKTRQVSRWQDIRSFLGWRWEWEVREWWDGGGAREWEGYYSPALWGWRGRARSPVAAKIAVERAFAVFTRPLEPKYKWSSEYRDG